MMLDELLSFHQHFWPSQFPIEARYFEYKASEPSLILRRRRIVTPEELRAFQKELTKREQLYEWSFLAYYEPLVLRQDEVLAQEAG